MRQFKKVTAKSRLCLFFLIIFLFSVSITAAQDKVVVIPLFGDEGRSCACQGTLSDGKRWCNNGNGTVTDMTTCLVWLQDSDCMGKMNWNDAITRPIEELRDGVCGLSDGSVWGDWRLPTLSELDGITQGNEAVAIYAQYWFTGVQLDNYWSCTRVADSDVCIYLVKPGVAPSLFAIGITPTMRGRFAAAIDDLIILVI